VRLIVGRIHRPSRGDADFRERNLRDRLVAIALVTAGFDIVCAVLAFLFALLPDL
jgi:hypothetical protein